MTASKRDIASDLRKVDAHVLDASDYQDIPELGDEFFDRADYHEGGKLMRRGRPRADRPKVATSIRLSQDVLDRFRASGPGWQSRIDEALKDWLSSHPGQP